MGQEPDAFDRNAALAALAWQVDLGVTEAISETALNRYALPDKVAAPAKPAPAPSPSLPADPVAEAETRAAAATTLPALREAIAAFAWCDLRKGARNLVFNEGDPGAPLMIVGGAPGREEDAAGRPFAGAEGALLDRMLAAIGRARGASDPREAAYLIPALPWRPPADREPTAEETAMLRPFLLRHIALKRPIAVIAMGNTALAALLDRRGIQRLRGAWLESAGVPVMPMLSPAHLLRTPLAKREAWTDLQAVRARLS